MIYSSIDNQNIQTNKNKRIIIDTQNFSYFYSFISFLYFDDGSILINLNLSTIMYSQRDIAGKNIKKYSINYRKEIIFLFHICVMKYFFSPLVSFWQFKRLQNMIDEKRILRQIISLKINGIH